MPAKRDTRIEAARLRILSPHQTVENQSLAWGIRCHSCTWREGLAPSWWTELRGEDSPRDLPGGLDHGIGHSRPPKAITECVRKL